MASFGKVVKTAGKVVITPVRIADNFALNVAADGSHYLLTKAVPPSWVWNRVPAGVKTALKNQLLDHNSRTRVTLDSFVTAAAGLAVADKVAGPDVAIYREIIDFYVNNRLSAAGSTIGIPSAAIAIYDIVKHGHGIPNWGKNAYGAALVTATALLFGSTLFAHPVGIRGVSAPEEQKPAAANQLTQRDLEGYITSTLMPQIDAKIKSGQLTPDQLNAAVTDAVDKYVKTVLVPQMEKTVGAVTEEQRKAMELYTRVQIQMALSQAGYATGADLAATNAQIGDLGKKVDDLASRIQQPTGTPQGLLEQYLQGNGYVVPGSVLKSVAGANSSGLAAALGVSAEVLGTFTNGRNDDGEFNALTVTRGGVNARAQYGQSIGQRDVPLNQTNAAALTGYLQIALGPMELSAIIPVK